jgi:hypothetical protein
MNLCLRAGIAMWYRSPRGRPRISASGLALLSNNKSATRGPRHVPESLPLGWHCYTLSRASLSNEPSSQNLCLWAGIAIADQRFARVCPIRVPESLPLGWHCYTDQTSS